MDASEGDAGSGAAAGFARSVLRACGHVLGRGADLVVPPACAACQKPVDRHHVLCARCWTGVSFIRPPLCDVLGIPLPFPAGERIVSARALAAPPAYDRARAVALHADTMRRLVHQFKYADRQEARPLLGRLLREAGRELLADAELVVPVPMGRWRLILRHYNQAAILAVEIGRLTGIPVEPLALRRRRRARRQVGLTAAQRRENVAGAFAVPPRQVARIAGRRVLLVDDVITTGATVEACARALKRAGATHVDVLALALVADAVLLPA